jgi:hypothetical protein
MKGPAAFLFHSLFFLLATGVGAVTLPPTSKFGAGSSLDRGLFTRVMSDLESAGPSPKIAAPRKNYLAMAQKSLTKTLNRRLGIDKLMDMVMIPRYDEHPLIMPMSIPQISDARITVQTFNSPPKPLAPGMLPKQDFKYNINIPERQEHVHPHQKKIINVVLPGQFDEELRGIVANSFRSALQRHLATHPGLQIAEDAFKFNILETPTERTLQTSEIDRRMSGVTQRIAALNKSYRTFQSELAERLQHMGGILGQTEKIKLDFMIA